MSERFGSSVSLFYGSADYISSGFEQRLLGATPAFTYDINKNLKGNLTYTYSFSDSNIETAGYTKNTVFLGLTAEF
ncbi:MAG TPA: outer membrane beta-barrel protein [Candidatus Wunengus sp. YC60]|uniref:outer membrane beta-barrel protein n=1 Tax=Candidatus Wunengus sp. YC60 TaxID=3367697 RepID=UPI00402A4647